MQKEVDMLLARSEETDAKEEGDGEKPENEDALADSGEIDLPPPLEPISTETPSVSKDVITNIPRPGKNVPTTNSQAFASHESGKSSHTHSKSVLGDIDELIESSSSGNLTKQLKPYRRRYSNGTMLHMFQSHAFSRGIYTSKQLKEDEKVRSRLPKSIQPNDAVGSVRGMTSYIESWRKR